MGALLPLLVLAAAATPNPDLDAAEKQFEDFKFVEAERSLVRALGTPHNDRATVLRIYELRGILDATTSKRTAVDHFGRLLALDPERTLPRDLGPRILTPFYEARGRLGDNPPVHLEATATPGEKEQHLTVKLTSDSYGLGAWVKLWWRVGNGEWQSKAEPEAAGSATVDHVVLAEAVEYYAQLLNADEGVLLESASAAAPLKVNGLRSQAVAPPPVVEEKHGPLELSTARKGAIAAAAVGVATLAGAAISGIVSSATRGEVQNPKRDESGRPIGFTVEHTRELEDRTVGSAVAANVLLVCGAALVATGAVIFVVDPGRGPAVSVGPAPGGVVVAGSF